jgi:hypothetical protein
MDTTTDLKEKTRQGIITGTLWLVTVVLGVLSFFAGRRVFLDTYSRLFPGYLAPESRDGLSLMNILISFPLAFLVIAIIIGGFEYHFRRAGTQESRWMFAYTLAIEAGFLLLAVYL